ncbi:hypothetical protein AERO9A_280008 [Aeromonas salmonicida]|nr:hypothetical protein AERO9A_280008 [Aeromonas salmonicida]
MLSIQPDYASALCQRSCWLKAPFAANGIFIHSATSIRHDQNKTFTLKNKYLCSTPEKTKNIKTYMQDETKDIRDDYYKRTSNKAMTTRQVLTPSTCCCVNPCHICSFTHL